MREPRLLLTISISMTVACAAAAQQPPCATPAAAATTRVARERISAAVVDTRATTRPPLFHSIPPTPPNATTKRGFDDAGEAYVEIRLADGTIKRMQRKGVTLIKPDGTTEFIPAMTTFSNTQPPTPPELPEDPKLGRGWVELHNDALLDVIRTLVGNDNAEMEKFSTAEKKAAGDKLFNQIAYRTRIATFLAGDR